MLRVTDSFSQGLLLFLFCFVFKLYVVDGNVLLCVLNGTIISPPYINILSILDELLTVLNYVDASSLDKSLGKSN